MIFLTNVKPFVIIFYILADVIANYFMLFFWQILLPYFWLMFMPLICGGCFLPHWSSPKILLILFVLADVIANVFLADLIAFYPVAGFIPLVF